MESRHIPMRIAKEQLPKLAREASLGSRLTITVHGRPLADLVPHVPAPDHPRPARILPVRVKLAPGPSLEEILEEMRGER